MGIDPQKLNQLLEKYNSKSLATFDTKKIKKVQPVEKLKNKKEK